MQPAHIHCVEYITDINIFMPGINPPLKNTAFLQPDPFNKHRKAQMWDNSEKKCLDLSESLTKFLPGVGIQHTYLLLVTSLCQMLIRSVGHGVPLLLSYVSHPATTALERDACSWSIGGQVGFSISPITWSFLCFSIGTAGLLGPWTRSLHRVTVNSHLIALK